MGSEFRVDEEEGVVSQVTITLKQLVEESWHDPEVDATVGDRIALMHSQLSEVLEEYRNNQPLDRIYCKLHIGPVVEESDWGHDEISFQNNQKPEGVPIELADVLIRIEDFCGKHGIDLERAVAIKLAFNKTRPRRHGGKKI